MLGNVEKQGTLISTNHLSFEDQRAAESVDTFENKLKTFLFSLALNLILIIYLSTICFVCVTVLVVDISFYYTVKKKKKN